MSIAPLPTPLQHLAGRRFSFYPPIRNLQPNEWLYRRATWTECVVMNAKSGQEVWIPRMFLGEVSEASRVDEPLMVVRLQRELEFRSGAILPRERRVIELPVAVNDSRPAASGSPRLAPVINIRLEPKPETRTWRWIGVSVVLGAVAATVLANIAWQSQPHPRPDLFHSYRPWLQLTADDNYASTIHKMGAPATVYSRTAGGHYYKSLVYTARHYAVILMGADAADARYIGTLDTHGRVLDAVTLRDGSNGEAFLRSPALR